MSGYSNWFSVGGGITIRHSIVYPKVFLTNLESVFRQGRSGIIKHSLHNGVVLTMENRVLLFPLMLGGFGH